MISTRQDLSLWYIARALTSLCVSPSHLFSFPAATPNHHPSGHRPSHRAAFKNGLPPQKLLNNLCRCLRSSTTHCHHHSHRGRRRPPLPPPYSFPSFLVFKFLESKVLIQIWLFEQKN
ncbi:hypothetical protein CMV_007750 [Castanea mollissima]|uniref:Uncharacterized protein n=1 Tax=Castanea mollissima TaxID=60419 RepID=A0A8J4RMQ1_9ROSI|nr:hypothetical protein CMV_007750 [Castanea mollissima]